MYVTLALGPWLFYIKPIWLDKSIKIVLLFIVGRTFERLLGLHTVIKDKYGGINYRAGFSRPSEAVTPSHKTLFY